MQRIRRLLLTAFLLATCGPHLGSGARAQAARPVAPKVAVWLYRFRDLDNDALLANLKARGVGRVFLSVPRSLLMQSVDKLQSFVAKAHAAGIEVHAMTLEDPSFVLQENHARASREIDALLAYCREHPAASFDGIHLDAEPHMLFQGKGERTAADWAANEALMKQYSALLEQTSRQVQERGLKGLSGQPLRLSAAIAWWYNERAKDGPLPSGSAKLLGKSLDFVVPMVYDGIGGSAADVIRRVDDELQAVPTVIGVARKEYPSEEALQSAIEKLNERYSASPNFQGVCVFEYHRWFGIPRK
jgi:hypothetical protein